MYIYVYIYTGRMKWGVCRNYLSNRSIDDYTEFIIYANYNNGIDIYMRDNCWTDESRWAFYQSFEVANPKLWQEITTMTYVGEAYWRDMEAMMMGPMLFAERD